MGAFLVLVLAAVLALPLWLPWFLLPGLRTAGVEVGSYERLSYGRLALRDVRYRDESLVFTAERVETLQPVFWAGRWAGLSGAAREGFKGDYPERMPIVAEAWHVQLPADRPSAEEPAMTSMADLLDRVKALVRRASLLRPGIDFRDGTIQYEGEILEVPRIFGGLDRIQMELESARHDQPVLIEIRWREEDKEGAQFAIETETRVLGEPLLNRMFLGEDAAQERWDLSGTGVWGGNDWRFEGSFGPDNWWPDAFTLEATDWQVAFPWREMGYTSLAGGLRLNWADERLEYAMNWEMVPTGDAVPLAAWPEGPVVPLPPVSVELSGHGSFTHVGLEQLSLESPGLAIHLEQPLELSVAPLTLAQSSRLHFMLRLEEFIPLARMLSSLLDDLDLGLDSSAPHGTLSGSLEAFPRPGGWPTAVLELDSPGFGWSTLYADAFQLEAQLEWPEVRLSKLRLEMRDGSQLSIEGQGRVPERWLETVALRLELAPEPVRGLLPDGIEFGRLVLQAEAQGQITDTWDHLLSSGQLEITQLVLPSVQPLEPVRIRWHPAENPPATGTPAEHHWQVALQAADSTIDVEGALRVAFDEGWIEVPIHAFDWRPGSRPTEEPLPAVFLATPVTLVLRDENATDDAQEPQWNLLLPEMVVGPAGVAQREPTNLGPSIILSTDVKWPERGTVGLDMKGWNSRWLRDWLVLPEFQDSIAPAVESGELEHFALTAAWEDGPATFQMEMALRLPHLLPATAAPDVLRVVARLTGAEDRVTIDSLVVEDRSGVWFAGSGELPLVFLPAATADPVRWNASQPVEFLGTLEAREDLSMNLDRVGHLTLAGLAAEIRAGGSMIEPSGRLQASFDQLTLVPAPDQEAEEMAPITGFQLGLVWQPETVQLQSLDLSVAGQEIQVTGSVPLEAGFWANLPESLRSLDVAASHGRVLLGPLQLEALSSFLPGLLRAQGEIRMDARWEPGLEIGGELEFRGLATNPLPTSGSVQDIGGRVELEGSIVRLTGIRADLGGRQVGVEGWLDLEPTFELLVRQRPGSWEELLELNALPLWDLAVTADRIPVVRRPGLVIRTGLDIRLTHDGQSAPLISGTVSPHDSVFITDVRTMVPRGPATPMPRPPFVEVEHPFFGDWRLQVEVQGDRFLRVRSPVFRGDVSVGVNVGGQLSEPVLVGDVMIADGRVQFPFGNLRVTQGLVSLSELHPNTLTVLVTASSRVYGYLISMTVSGTAESPSVVFGSNPPLSSEEIVLMLTAGQLPQDEIAFTAQQRATALASYLGKSLIDTWALEEPAEERLEIRSGESISVGGRSTYHLEYMLSNRWSLTGEYDEYDAVNAGVKYRLLYR
jgi:translocation and assembly module TamB